MNDCYKILGVSPSDSEDVVKKSYKSLCRKYHPDMGDGDVAKFLKVQKAWKDICKIGFNTSKKWSHKSLFSIF